MSRIKLKNIIRWEQLTGKAFANIDFNNEADVKSFIYITQDVVMNYDVYQNIALSKAFFKEQKELLLELNKLDQFLNKNKQTETDSGTNEPLYKLAYYLIANGLDPNYVMNDLSIADIPGIISAMQDVKKETMEHDRLFTYLNIMPHISSKSITGPADILPFPWEIDEKEKARVKELEEASQLFNQFSQNNGK